MLGVQASGESGVAVFPRQRRFLRQVLTGLTHLFQKRELLLTLSLLRQARLNAPKQRSRIGPLNPRDGFADGVDNLDLLPFRFPRHCLRGPGLNSRFFAAHGCFDSFHCLLGLLQSGDFLRQGRFMRRSFRQQLVSQSIIPCAARVFCLFLQIADGFLRLRDQNLQMIFLRDGLNGPFAVFGLRFAHFLLRPREQKFRVGGRRRTQAREADEADKKTKSDTGERVPARGGHLASLYQNKAAFSTKPAAGIIGA